jgi:hypothetical protein
MPTPIPTKTFSFKAPTEWEARIDHALEALSDLTDFGSAEGAQMRQELELSILREPERLTRAANQSDLMRGLVELLLAAVEKVQRDQRFGDEFAAAGSERATDERDFTRLSTRSAARRWH